MKTPILTPLDLSARILELQAKKEQQELQIKLQFSETMHSISPGNLIKTGFNKLTSLPIGPGLVGTGINLGVEFLSNKLLGNSGGTVKKLAKQAINIGVSTILGKKAERVKTYASVFLNRLVKGNKSNR